MLEGLAVASVGRYESVGGPSCVGVTPPGYRRRGWHRRYHMRSLWMREADSRSWQQADLRKWSHDVAPPDAVVVVHRAHTAFACTGGVIIEEEGRRDMAGVALMPEDQRA